MARRGFGRNAIDAAIDGAIDAAINAVIDAAIDARARIRPEGARRLRPPARV